MIRFSLSHLLKQWKRQRRRWPLTRQITMVFTALMIGNAALISTALDYWGEYVAEREIKSLSPESQRAYKNAEKGQIPQAADLKRLNAEFELAQIRVVDEIDTALYSLIVIAAGVTMLVGHLLLGRLGRGLVSVASAARRITDGDLTARARPVGFASREETQLISDFNTMSAALQRTERELAESAASIAHELRTPLTILRGRLHGIAEGVFAFQPQEVQGLLYQVEGLGRLVDDLQTLSLANSKRLTLATENTDLAKEVNRVLVATTPDLIAAGLEPVLTLQAAPMIADGARIRQVISAVLMNACGYAPQSGMLRITTRAEGSFVILEIVDHGPGLPNGGDIRVFDRFWRGEASRNRNSGGSGLGLSVVRAIVEAHGGTATLRNHAGGGAFFEMRLPQRNV